MRWTKEGPTRAVCLILVFVGGCRWAHHPPYEIDPLLEVHKPIAGDVHGAEVVRLPLQAPLVPHPPPPLWQPAHVATLPEGIPPPAPAPGVSDPIEELPPPRPQEAEEGADLGVIIPASASEFVIQSSPALSAHSYHHDAEYTQLRGEVDRHYRGFVSLRYCDPAQDDPWGGKVYLLDDPRLSELQSGDVIEIVGELRPEERPTAAEGHGPYPGFRIRELTYPEVEAVLEEITTEEAEEPELILPVLE